MSEYQLSRLLDRPDAPPFLNGWFEFKSSFYLGYENRKIISRDVQIANKFFVR